MNFPATSSWARFLPKLGRMAKILSGAQDLASWLSYLGQDLAQDLPNNLPKILGKILPKILGKLLGKILGKILGKLLGKLLGKFGKILGRNLVQELVAGWVVQNDTCFICGLRTRARVV